MKFLYSVSILVQIDPFKTPPKKQLYDKKEHVIRYPAHEVETPCLHVPDGEHTVHLHHPPSASMPTEVPFHAPDWFNEFFHTVLFKAA
jgi:hypothetical protein